MIDWDKYKRDLQVAFQKVEAERKTKVVVTKTWVCKCGQTHVGTFYINPETETSP